MVCLWNIDRHLNPHKADASVEVTSCVLSIAFHPDIASLFVIGTFNGSITVIDREKPNGQEIIASSPLNNYSHMEPVNEVAWIATEIVNKTYKILSLGGDGKILLWIFKKGTPTLVLSGRMEVTSRDVPRFSHLPMMEMGITSATFSHSNPDHFVVGTEGGSLVRCSVRHGMRQVTSNLPLNLSILSL